MPKRRKRYIPVHLSLPAEPPTQAEIDAIIGTAGRTGVVLIRNDSRSQKTLRHEWDKLPEFAPILCAWFPHEVRKVRQAINYTLQAWEERPLPHPPRNNPKGKQNEQFTTG